MMVSFRTPQFLRDPFFSWGWNVSFGWGMGDLKFPWLNWTKTQRKSAAPALKQCRTEPKCESAHSWLFAEKFHHPNPSVKHWMGMGYGKCMGNCPIHLVNSYGIFVGKYIIPIYSHWVLTQRMWVLKGWCSCFLSDDLFASLKIDLLNKMQFPESESRSTHRLAAIFYMWQLVTINLKLFEWYEFYRFLHSHYSKQSKTNTCNMR